MTRNYQRDYDELPKFTEQYKGRKAVDAIDAYAAKRKVVGHRICKTFWDLVDSGVIKTTLNQDGYHYID